MRRILLASLGGHTRRLFAGGLAIVVGVAFVGTVLIVMDSVKSGFERILGAQYQGADLVVTYLPEPQALAAVTDLETVSATAVLADYYASGIEYPDGSRQSGRISAIPTAEELRWHELVEGRFPQTADEVAVAPEVTEETGAAVGDTITVPFWDAERELSVVGVVDAVSMFDDTGVYADEAAMLELAEDRISGSAIVALRPGVDLESARSAVVDAVADDFRTPEVRTAEEQIEEELGDFLTAVDVMGGILLGFTAIAMFVAMLVVANTFTIVVAQRARELALFRCVGAAKSQVFRAVTVEALLLGIAAAGLGVLLAVGFSRAAMDLLDANFPQVPIPLDSMSVTVTAIGIPAVIGVVTTLLAALAPARRATRVPALAALHPESAITVRSRAGLFRLIVGGLLLFGGLGVLLFAMQGEHAEIGVVIGACGGFLAFLGVLMFGPLMTPAVVRLLGLVAKLAGGVPGKVSVGNAIRNPRRTAATAAALLIGVTLISTLSVGAATAQAAFVQTLDGRYPIDLDVRAGSPYSPDAGELPPGAVQTIEAIDGVAAVAGVGRAPVRIRPVDGDGYNSGWAGEVVGVDLDRAADAVYDASGFAGLEPGVILLDRELADTVRVDDGDQAEIRLEDPSEPIDSGTGEAAGPATTAQVRLVDAGRLPWAMLTTADFAELLPDAGPVGLWVRVDAGADLRDLVDEVTAAFAGVDDLQLDGSAPERALFDQIVGILLMVATALLAISVAIALVGVGNTLSLSMLERIRENALLRALGLTRGQLRATLAVEALLISGAAVLIGLVLGFVFGHGGAATLLRGFDVIDDVPIAIPFGRLGLVVVVALAAGVLASVLPARRAAKVPPSVALTA